MSTPKLSRNARDLHTAMCVTLEEAGIAEHRLDFRGKHPALVFQHGGRVHRVAFSLTPSDHRTVLNMKSTLRRIIAAPV